MDVDEVISISLAISLFALYAVGLLVAYHFIVKFW